MSLEQTSKDVEISSRYDYQQDIRLSHTQLTIISMVWLFELSTARGGEAEGASPTGGDDSVGGCSLQARHFEISRITAL